jgi:hypothetical protein
VRIDDNQDWACDSITTNWRAVANALHNAATAKRNDGAEMRRRDLTTGDLELLRGMLARWRPWL